MEIRGNHPLRRLFEELVRRRFRGIDLGDPEVAAYVPGLLAEFVAKGKRLEDVGEMLIESNPLLEGRSFDRERAVRKHIGDYTLFLAGLFPEYVAALPRYSLRLDAFELCVYGLNLVKRDLDQMQNPNYLEFRELLG